MKNVRTLSRKIKDQKNEESFNYRDYRARRGLAS